MYVSDKSSRGEGRASRDQPRDWSQSRGGGGERTREKKGEQARSQREKVRDTGARAEVARNQKREGRDHEQKREGRDHEQKRDYQRGEQGYEGREYSREQGWEYLRDQPPSRDNARVDNSRDYSREYTREQMSRDQASRNVSRDAARDHSNREARSRQEDGQRPQHREERSRRENQHTGWPNQSADRNMVSCYRKMTIDNILQNSAKCSLPVRSLFMQTGASSGRKHC